MEKLIAILIAAALAGCATTPRQIVDMQGVDPAKFAQDNYECERYANQVDVGGNAATGALGGALIGGVIGGLLGGRDGALFGAKVFGVTGAAQGAGSAAQDKKQVAARCMVGRGYSVLL
ncbi:MAG: glycine zipper family protein [Pseudomonadota bacterium]